MKIRKALPWVLGVPAAAAVLGLLALYLLQDKLLFDPRHISAERLRRLREDREHVQELVLRAPDGAALHGWLVRGEAPAPAPLLIYYGGNGEETSWMAGRVDRLAGWSLLLVSYRGYGLSEGRPGEKAMLADALLAYDAVTRRPEIDPRRVAVMGRSIGSGVAVYLAARREVRGVVLVSPYDSITAVARGHFPLLPVGPLLRHRFPAASWAPGVTVPLLALIAGDDRVVPPERSFRLVERWGGPVETHLVEGTGHNSIDHSPEYWESIGRFLSGL